MELVRGAEPWGKMTFAPKSGQCTSQVVNAVGCAGHVTWAMPRRRRVRQPGVERARSRCAGHFGSLSEIAALVRNPSGKTHYTNRKAPIWPFAALRREGDFGMVRADLRRSLLGWGDLLLYARRTEAAMAWGKIRFLRKQQ